MTLKSLIQKRPGDAACFMGQQLCLHPVNPGRLLQRLDDMGQELELDLARVGKTSAVGHEKIADHSLAALVDKKAVAKDSPAVNRGISGKYFRIDIAQNHLRRPVVIPGEKARPDLRLIVEQGAQVRGRKVSEIENLHEAPAKSVRAKYNRICDGRTPSLVRSTTRGKPAGQRAEI